MLNRKCHWQPETKYHLTPSRDLIFFNSEGVESNQVVNKFTILQSWDAAQASTVAVSVRHRGDFTLLFAEGVCVRDGLCMSTFFSVYCFCCFNHSACGKKAQVTDSAVEELDSLRGTRDECDSPT